MKNKDLIKELQKYSPDTEVCIFDLTKSEAEASDEPSSVGIYNEFGVELMHDDETMEHLKEDNPEAKNFISLTFETDDT